MPGAARRRSGPRALLAPHLGPQGLGLGQHRRRGAEGPLVERQLLAHGGPAERGRGEAGAADGALTGQDGRDAPVALGVRRPQPGQLLDDGRRRQGAGRPGLDHHGLPRGAVRGVGGEGAHLALPGREVLPGRVVDEPEAGLRLLTPGRTAAQEARLVVRVGLGHGAGLRGGGPPRLRPRRAGRLRHGLGRRDGLGLTGRERGRRLALGHGLRLGHRLRLGHGLGLHQGDRLGLGLRPPDQGLQHARETGQGLAHLGEVGLQGLDTDGVRVGLAHSDTPVSAYLGLISSRGIRLDRCRGRH
jgi:hypothetical protein